MALVFIGHLLITNISLDMFSLVVGMPSYETWSLFHCSHKVEKDWEGTFQTNEKKIPMVIENQQGGMEEFDDLRRVAVSRK